MKKLSLVALIAILCVGFVLRRHNNTIWPREGATFDEYAWTWLGMNILQKHVPISWSPHPQYKIRTHYVSPKGTRFWLVEPYLEHPPLFGLFAGTYALLSGAKDMYSVDIHHIRGLALVLGLLSILMIFFLTQELYDRTTALFASVLYSTIPTIVIGSRIVQNENFFIPVFLSILFFIVKFLKSNNKRLFYIAAILAGLLTLSKVPWWAATVSSVLIFLYHKRYSEAVRFVIIVAAFFSLFFLWGWYWDSTVFQNLWRLQLSRYDITFDGIYALFTHPILVDRAYVDGWILLGWIAFFMLVGDMKRHGIILLGLLGYFAVYFLGIPNEPGHGWYRYPFYPFLVIAFAYTFVESFKKHSLFAFFSISLIGVSLLQLTWNSMFGFSFAVYRTFIIGSGLTGTAIFFKGTLGRRLAKVSTIGLVCVLLLLNLWAVWIYNEQ